MSFFYIALDEIVEGENKMIQHQAIANRGSQAEKFDDFLKLFDKQSKKHTQDNHEANIAMLNKKL